MNPFIPIIAEVGFILIAIAVFYVATKRFGNYKSGIFLAGAVLWTVPLENFTVLYGGDTYYHYSGQLWPGYPGYFFWLGLVPLWIILGWFIFAMSGFLIFHTTVLPRSRAVLQALASGLFALNIDFMMDPVASSNGLWVWTSSLHNFLGVPLFNFVGWFLLIFLYDLIASHTVFDSKPMPILSSLERRIFPSGNYSFQSGQPNLKLLVFRIVLLETMVIIFLILLYYGISALP